MDDETRLILKPGVRIKPELDLKQVENILSDFYGIQCGSVKELNGYDDNNYWIKPEKQTNHDGYVLKIINLLDSKKPLLFDAQDKILLHLNRNAICCPKPVKNKFGEYFALKSLASGEHIVRLLEFVPGKILHQVECSKNLFYQAGVFIARIDEALKSFSHEVYATHRTLWMLDSVPQLCQFLYVVEDPSRKALVEEVISEFVQSVVPAASQLEKGMIHGDFNEQNVLVEEDNPESVKGVLDFGDSQYSSYVYEVAITMTYMMVQGRSLEFGGDVLKGYVSVHPLTNQELGLLKVCIAARLCQSLVIGLYSSLQDPGNSYILTTSKPGWVLLGEIWAQPVEELLRIWME